MVQRVVVVSGNPLYFRVGGGSVAARQMTACLSHLCPLQALSKAVHTTLLIQLLMNHPVN
jgi:hypothetical protein